MKSDYGKGDIFMWKCPNCGREFKNTNQGHYCGKSPKTVDEYIASQPYEYRSHVSELRDIIKKSVPDITEYIAWSMPYYKKNGISISFAACKTYISFYLGAEILENFGSELTGFKIKKNAVYLPYDKELPSEIIGSIIKQLFSKTNQNG